MSAGTANFDVDQGSDFQIKLTLNDSAGLPIDLTGHVFSGQLRTKYSDVSAVASFSFTVLNQTTAKGQVLAKLSASSTTAITLPTPTTQNRDAITYLYDIESDNSGAKRRWLQGIINLIPEVTK